MFRKCFESRRPTIFRKLEKGLKMYVSRCAQVRSLQQDRLRAPADGGGTHEVDGCATLEVDCRCRQFLVPLSWFEV